MRFGLFSYACRGNASRHPAPALQPPGLRHLPARGRATGGRAVGRQRHVTAPHPLGGSAFPVSKPRVTSYSLNSRLLPPHHVRRKCIR
eukprot:5094207-Prymnesium_polylepis.1